ncbi:hypothetical protein Trco_002749 [Trichoderma cornu-damae]|uniref:Uncharacterized protein n=1 Tax=Trichoderma cornu-damae TaxID=654480 RepID=A0A9P8QVA8_9HYPO|nr:hypothetical protein Trco_002749 [Trichoderma cornu-damae]
MLGQKKLRSVSWNEKVQIIYFPKAEPIEPAKGCPLSVHDASHGGADAEAMTPSEFDCYRRRMWSFEKIRVLLREICFDKVLVDRLPEKKIRAMDASFAPLYERFRRDRQITRYEPGAQNKALRWRIMSQIWKLLREHVFGQLAVADKNPLSDPVLTVMRAIVAEKIKQFLEPFKMELAKDLDSKIDDVGNAARELLLMLLYDNDAKYSFCDIEDLDRGGPMKLYSSLEHKTHRVDICGADHRDASMDVVFIPVTGGLMRHVRETTVVEKKAWVVLYRPSSEEVVDVEYMH